MNSVHSDGMFLRPSIFKPLMNGRGVDASFSGPVFDGHGQSTIGNQVIRASILRLVFLGNPKAVLLGVVLVVVASFNGMSIGTRPHVLQESIESFPFVGVLDSFTAPVFEVPHVRIITPGFHSAPRDVGAGLSTYGEPVGLVDFGDRLATHASTRPGVSVGQLVSVDRLNLSAVALAEPVVQLGILLDDDESMKPLAGLRLKHTAVNYQTS